jgi:hypothetical protein
LAAAASASESASTLAARVHFAPYRATYDPEFAAWVNESEGRISPLDHPHTFVGGSEHPKTRILLKFPRADWQKHHVVSAQLILHPSLADYEIGAPTIVEARNITEGWSAQTNTGTQWTLAPKSESISKKEIRGPRSAIVRLDVTAYVRALQKGESEGLLVEGAGEGAGVSVSTYAPGPQLEIYMD